MAVLLSHFPAGAKLVYCGRVSKLDFQNPNHKTLPMALPYKIATVFWR